MARVIRLLWRLDFDVSYSYLDKRGSALNILTNTVKDFWTNVGPGNLPLSFAAEKTEEDKSYTTFSWEMTCLNGTSEWPHGLDIDDVFNTAITRSVDRIVKEALRLGEVRVLNRAGVRIFCVEKFAKKKKPAMKRFGGLVESHFSEGLSNAMGPAEDIAFVYEGKSDDRLGYRAQFGPYAPKNPRLVFLKQWDTELTKHLDENDIFFDIDIFEQDFSFSEHSLYRWASTKVSKAATFMEFCAKNVG